jgi:hypothetical protein
MTSGGDAQATTAEAGLAPHRALSPRRRLLDPWFRRAVLIALSALVVAALLGAFGQQPVTSHAQGAAGGLSVQSPSNLRGGLIFQARFTVTARRALRAPALVLEHGWFEAMSVNSIVPQPTGQVSRDGEVRLTYPRMRAGEALRVWIYFQVNPTTVGSRSQAVELDDGSRRLERIERSARVWP